ncbi:MAG: hypothetical protein KJ025_04450 [Burkholderiales bacterium]|nr:hypothetical protein [Burkholderiales bacterium]
MIEPRSYVAFAPRGAGLMCALFYFTDERSVYGWYTGSRAGEFPARFFMLEDYFSPHETRFYASAADDVYSGWVRRAGGGETPLDPPPPVPEPLLHELERLQDAFVREWLAYQGDAHAAEHAAAYAARELAFGAVNLRADKLGKLRTDAAVWTYATPDCDLNIVGTLRRHWSLDYGPEV